MRNIVVYTDGGSRGNPGPAAIGVWIETLDKKYGVLIGAATNNDAEYQAVIFALKKIKALVGAAAAKTARVECRLDSELVVRQLTHRYKITKPNTQKYFLEVWNAMLDFGAVDFTHVPRERNTVADGMVNAALDSASQQDTLFR